MSRTLLTSMLLLAFSLTCNGDPDAYLKRFIGQWVGTYAIEDLNTGEIKIARIEQVNYWLDGALYQMTALQPDGEATVYEQSTVQTLNGILKSHVVSSTRNKHFYGWIKDGHIWWTNPVTEQAMQMTIYTERLQPGPDGFTLKITGYQWQTELYGEFPQVISAKLRRLKHKETLTLFED
jgi:hypothetical protein